MTIQEILHSTNYTELEKKVALEKWKFGQLPAWYRKDNKRKVLEKIEQLKINFTTSNTLGLNESPYKNGLGQALPWEELEARNG